LKQENGTQDKGMAMDFRVGHSARVGLGLWVWVGVLTVLVISPLSLGAQAQKTGSDGKNPPKSTADKPGVGKSAPKNDSPEVESDPKRKAEIVEEFQKVLNEEPTTAETANLILVAPKSVGKKAMEWAKLAEKHRETAIKALKLDEDEVQETKIAVFLWQTPDQLRNFIRRVERRSVDKDDIASINGKDWVLRAAGIAPTTKEGALGDHRAGELVAGLLVTRAAKRAATVPDWLTAGFGRATTWKLASANLRPLLEEKRKVALLCRKYGPWEIMNGEPSSVEAPPLQASVLYYMAFVGTFAPKFPKFIEAFEPDENNNTRPLGQILEFAEINRETLSSSWKSWAGR